MKLLVLGGTKNLGGHVVESALRDGHDVTLFNRGRTNPSLFSTVRQLTGERADPAVLATGEWDGVIDMSGFLVADVRRSAELLRDHIDARDLATFLLHLTVNRLPGPYNAVGPTTTMSALAAAWRSAVPDPPPINWTPAEDRFHLPTDGSNDGTFQLDNTQALATGLNLRPDETIARDYVAWIRAGNTPPPPPH